MGYKRGENGGLVEFWEEQEYEKEMRDRISWADKALNDITKVLTPALENARKLILSDVGAAGHTEKTRNMPIVATAQEAAIRLSEELRNMREITADRIKFLMEKREITQTEGGCRIKSRETSKKGYSVEVFELSPEARAVKKMLKEAHSVLNFFEASAASAQKNLERSILEIEDTLNQLEDEA